MRVQCYDTNRQVPKQVGITVRNLPRLIFMGELCTYVRTYVRTSVRSLLAHTLLTNFARNIVSLLYDILNNSVLFLPMSA